VGVGIRFGLGSGVAILPLNPTPNRGPYPLTVGSYFVRQVVEGGEVPCLAPAHVVRLAVALVRIKGEG
jgi:hypothetical protein